MAVVTLYSGGTEILSTYDMIIQIGKPSGAQCCELLIVILKPFKNTNEKKKLKKMQFASLLR